ncbi:MAG TPA: hypothetical protein VKA84_11725 [Gemmatimonadaceae bacterium]|nr:hypothetical protein [Gemmatimonadaceae bacterium]
MRWSSCSVLRVACALSTLALAALGCTSRTTNYYKPAEGQERLSVDEARLKLDDMLRVECPRLMSGGRLATGEGELKVDVDRDGNVQQAWVSRSTGDSKVDDMFAAVAASLEFESPSGMKNDTGTGRVRIGYACGQGSAVATLEPRG